jgi:hypothetical protein
MVRPEFRCRKGLARIRLCCVTQPDPAQIAVLDGLGITMPKRMRLAERELPAFARSA